MDYRSKMQQALAFIEENLCEDFTLEEVAAHIGFSPFHFHRVFHSIIGDTVGAYVRKRRFAKATYELIHTEKRILDIAIEYGFDSQESFTRSFKQKLGVTPGRYRKDGRHYAVYLPTPFPEQDFPNHQGGTTMEAKIITRPAFYIIGIEMKNLKFAELPNTVPNNGNTIPVLWGAFNQRVGEIPNRVNDKVSFGICIPTDWSEFHYMCGVEVHSTNEVPEGMVVRHIPEAQYAVFTHRGTVDKIPDTTQYVYGQWLPQTGYEPILAPELELYDERFCLGSEDSEMEIWVPIK